jgi:Mn2+/Fe2+ NRAMP family transporter
MPGPFQMPPLPGLPFYIHPAILWAIILVAAVLIAVTFFRFIFAEPAERVNTFLVFFLALLFVFGLYAIAMNAPEITGFFRRITAPIFRW